MYARLEVVEIVRLLISVSSPVNSNVPSSGDLASPNAVEPFTSISKSPVSVPYLLAITVILSVVMAEESVKVI